MADSDFYGSKAAVAPLRDHHTTGPSITNLRTALSTANATYWTTARLNAATKVDMIYAARLAGLTVAGL